MTCYAVAGWAFINLADRTGVGDTGGAKEMARGGGDIRAYTHERKCRAIRDEICVRVVATPRRLYIYGVSDYYSSVVFGPTATAAPCRTGRARSFLVAGG